ncbi:hypothetical protein OSB04_011470 [Centaurea solstitialis]|uniref:Integrase catalytic domain-containing protein n=1 Tax=Centaurea solstitialis TaxID=347529 RepID=A0AA38TK77_9ASTR|nr:hypothetical protein OSB04_011470 [Centaurea solstitialis]
MQADALANLGSAFHDPSMENIPIIHLTTPTIEAKDEVQMNEEVYNWSIDIYQHSWMNQHALVQAVVFCGYQTCRVIYRLSCSLCNQSQLLQIGSGLSVETEDEELQSRGSLEIKITTDSLKIEWKPEKQGPKLQDIQFLKTNSIKDPRLDSFYDVSQIRRKSIEFSKKCTMENVGITQGAEALPTESHDKVRDKEVISFIQNNIIHRFGVPSEIMCDNGSQFISDKTRTFCEKRGIKLITSTPRYPQSNGLAESSNKVIINSIRKRLKGAKGKWVEELPSVLWANRTTARASTGQTPYSLVYGCEAVLPIEAKVPVARNRTFNQNVINLSYDLDALEELRENALRTMAAQKGLVERHFNKKVKAKIFQVGDYVLRHMFQNTQESNAGKLSIKWEGPYVISKVIGNGAYQLTTMEGIEIPRSWNAHHLKRYYF